ncbi:MAG: hypothetical protein U0136_07725 [Bdellovibrionota bacterium]
MELETPARVDADGVDSSAPSVCFLGGYVYGSLCLAGCFPLPLSTPNPALRKQHAFFLGYPTKNPSVSKFLRHARPNAITSTSKGSEPSLNC